MNMTPEQLREIAQRIWHETGGIIPHCDHHLHFGAALFAEFQKLQDSRIAELEVESNYFADQSDRNVLEMRAKCDELTAKLKHAGRDPLYAAPVAKTVITDKRIIELIRGYISMNSDYQKQTRPDMAREFHLLALIHVVLDDLSAKQLPFNHSKEPQNGTTT